MGYLIPLGFAHSLEIKGGWTNRDVKDWFGDYVAICVKSFGV